MDEFVFRTSTRTDSTSDVRYSIQNSDFFRVRLGLGDEKIRVTVHEFANYVQTRKAEAK